MSFLKEFLFKRCAPAKGGMNFSGRGSSARPSNPVPLSRVKRKSVLCVPYSRLYSGSNFFAWQNLSLKRVCACRRVITGDLEKWSSSNLGKLSNKEFLWVGRHRCSFCTVMEIVCKIHHADCLQQEQVDLSTVSKSVLLEPTKIAPEDYL